jgi:hypothetical protein
MDLTEIGWESEGSMHLSQDREQQQQALMNTVMNLRVSQNVGYFLTREP